MTDTSGVVAFQLDVSCNSKAHNVEQSFNMQNGHISECIKVRTNGVDEGDCGVFLEL